MQCEDCNKTIQRNNSRQRWCLRCAYPHSQMKREKKPINKIKCLYCGDLFETQGKGRKYCGRNCEEAKRMADINARWLEKPPKKRRTKEDAMSIFQTGYAKNFSYPREECDAVF